MGSALPLPFVSGTRILAGYRVQGTEDGKIRLLFLFSTAALEKLFFKHRPPRLAGSCFCAWELIEDGEANPFEWPAPASHRFQFRSRQLSTGLNGDGDFLIAGGVQSGEHANLINAKQLLNLVLNWCDRIFFSLHVQYVIDTAQDTNSPIGASHSHIAWIEISVPEHCRARFFIIEIRSTINLG